MSRSDQVVPARAVNGMVASIDRLASSAGLTVLRSGGSAADAAIATNAVLAVTSQHTCGLGGDLFAIVHPGGHTSPHAVNASGRAGSGASAEELRDQGCWKLPYRGDVRAVTVPGCVDGWCALHERYGRLDLEALLAPAIRYAEEGFAASPTLAEAAPAVVEVQGAEDFRGVSGRGPVEGEVVRRFRLGQLLRRIARDGRDGWYGGAFGESLVQLGDGLFTEDDVTAPHADWVAAISLEAWGHRLWTVPPNSQGYLTLASAGIAAGLDVPADVCDPAWAHWLIEASKRAGAARSDELHEHAGPRGLLKPDRLRRLRESIGPEAAAVPAMDEPGDTTYLCAIDSDGMAVSLIQSNAAGFGAHLVAPGTGVFLHNRGLGFNLEPGHPAEYGPGRRPPHTLAPALITGLDGRLHTVLGTMGGDRQPQVVLQLVASLLVSGHDPSTAVAAGRWGLATGQERPGFGTWDQVTPLAVDLEGHAPVAWDDLSQRGHRLRRRPALNSEFGHAQMITVTEWGMVGAADPRTRAGAALGF